MTSRRPVLPTNATDVRDATARNVRAVADFLRAETTGGVILLAATALALALANSPLRDEYTALRDHHLAIPPLGLDLSVGHWASELLLALFFFVAGTELKRELTVGELRRPADAALPAAAAVGGVALPALIYALVAATGDGDLGGWAVPVATDIAFVLGVLAVVGRHLPGALRSFLLTLAIVDDLIAVVIIAAFFTATLNPLALAGAAATLAVVAALHRRGVGRWYVYVPLALAVWVLTYHSGVHATIAGVALGMVLRVEPREDEAESPAERLEHLVHPYSAALAVPLFALFAAGVEVSPEALRQAADRPEVLGVVLGLVVGKLVGILGVAYLVARLTGARLNPELGWPDLAGGAMLAGIGFTVSLLMAELAFPEDPGTAGTVKIAVLLGSLLSAALATLLLLLRGRHHRDRQARRG